MTQLYREGDEKRTGALLCAVTSALAVIAAAALVWCVVLCAGINVMNEMRVRLMTTLISTAAGLIILWTADLFLLPLRNDRRHAARILSKEAAPLHGTVLRISPGRRIRGSIDIREVVLETGDGPRRLLISLKRSGSLPGPGTAVTVLEAEGYITAFEVCHE